VYPAGSGGSEEANTGFDVALEPVFRVCRLAAGLAVTDRDRRDEP
jgi:hypothetical protein